jgi:uncharacterized membrane protein YkvA (DUF1232 family)
MSEKASSPDTRHDETISTVVGKEREIEKKLKSQKALKALLEHGMELLQMVKDYFKGNYREVPYWAIGAAALALFYVLTPVDGIPDFILGLGYVDDAMILAFCLKLVETELKRYQEWKSARTGSVVEGAKKSGEES